jgi:cytochrome c oxidase assembly factor CtaG
VVLSHWSANAVVLVVAGTVAAVHLRGLRGMAAEARRHGSAGPGERPPGTPRGDDGSWRQAAMTHRAAAPRGLGREVAAFYGGLLLVVLALCSPLAYWSGRFIWVRSVQDLLLATVAPAFLVLGAPWLALRAGLGFRLPPGGEAAVPRRPPADGWERRALLTVIAFNVAWCGWHLPALYDGAKAHPAVYAAEVVSYLGLGVAFWLQIIGSRPVSPVLTPLRRVAMLAGTIVVSAVLGMVLVFGYGVAYPGYLGPGRHVLSVVYDQQAGGAVLWALVLPVYVTAGVALLIRWLNDEETQALATGLDRLLKPAKPAWPSRSGL